MSETWFWSDHHAGHHNIISFFRADGTTRLRPEFYDEVTERRDVDACMMLMAANFNEIVGRQDEVWFGGDVAFNEDYLKKFMQLLRPGPKKHLILGNHDRMDMRVYDKWFKSVRVSKSFRDHGFILTHYPVHVSCLSAKGGNRANVHGHTHWNLVKLFDDAHPLNTPDPRYINICVERTDYRPVHIEALAKKVPR